MKLNFMKRSRIQSTEYPLNGVIQAAMANTCGFASEGCAATCSEVRNSNPTGVRKSNRVSSWAVRLTALLAILFNGSLLQLTVVYWQSRSPRFYLYHIQSTRP